MRYRVYHAKVLENGRDALKYMGKVNSPVDLKGVGRITFPLPAEIDLKSSVARTEWPRTVSLDAWLVQDPRVMDGRLTFVGLVCKKNIEDLQLIPGFEAA